MCNSKAIAYCQRVVSMHAQIQLSDRERPFTRNQEKALSAPLHLYSVRAIY